MEMEGGLLESSLGFAPLLEQFLFSLQASSVTEAFLWILGGVFILAITLSVLSQGQRFVSETPTLLTSLGILGTFVGIVVGLMHFDPLDIDASIPMLLAGMKTAFMTSLIGMGSAILFKLLMATPLVSQRQNTLAPSNAGPKEILKALIDQNDRFDHLREAIAGDEESSLAGQLRMFRQDQRDHHNDALKAVGDVKTAIAGSEEDSLVGQLKHLRADERDRHHEITEKMDADRQHIDALAEKLWQELESFADMLSKSASEQVINALKEVIADFNKNLTEQFGENFKALDASVQKLVQWQENYRLQLEQMSAQYAQGVDAITETESSVAHIAEKSQQIPETMEKLNAVMIINQHQVDELSNHLDAFREIRDKAVDAVPEIRRQVDQTIQDIAGSVDAANEHFSTLLERSDAYIQSHDQKTKELLGQFIANANMGNEKIRDGLESAANQLSTAIAENTQEFTKEVQGLLQQTTDQVTGSVDTASEHYKKLLDNSDAYLEAHDQKSQELLERFIKNTNEGLEKIKFSLESGATSTRDAIHAGAVDFSNSVEKINSNLVATSEQIANQSHSIRQQLEEAFKNINENVHAMTATLSEQSTELSSTLKTAGQQILMDTEATQKQVADSLQQMQSRLEKALEEVYAAQTKTLDKTIHGFEEHMSSVISKTGDGVNRQLKAIDESMHQEIERVMTEMGKALAQITGKFVEDYTKLVNAMQSIVTKGENSSRGVKR